jgi:hypothetical protein
MDKMSLRNTCFSCERAVREERNTKERKKKKRKKRKHTYCFTTDLFSIVGTNRTEEEPTNKVPGIDFPSSTKTQENSGKKRNKQEGEERKEQDKHSLKTTKRKSKARRRRELCEKQRE